MKILVIRFSSIGDIVLTSPVVRALKNADKVKSVHFLTKQTFKDLLIHNPYIDKVHLLGESFSTLLEELKAESFDYLIDLHHNLRTWRVKRQLPCPAFSFDKYNWTKYKMTRFQTKGLAVPHIVQRYGDTLKSLQIPLDDGGLDFFLPESAISSAKEQLQASGMLRQIGDTLAIVLGASYQTKRWIDSHFIQLIQSYQRPVLLLGGKDAQAEASKIEQAINVPLFNVVGKVNILVAAAMMKECGVVLTHDTGFMHIAAAFRMHIVSLWGNTVPEFGMTPYKSPHQILEVKDLSCRPCSKLGFDQCPKQHFNCMNQISPEQVLQALRKN